MKPACYRRGTRQRGRRRRVDWALQARAPITSGFPTLLPLSLEAPVMAPVLILEVIPDVIREELRKLLPAPNRKDFLSIAELVQKKSSSC